MKLKIKEGTTSKIAKIFVQDSSATDGSGLTGLVYNTASLTAYWIAEGDASATAITLATATVGTYTSGGFIVVDATNMPGVYEFGIPNDAIDATSEGSVVIMLKGAANMAPVLLEIELDAIDYQDSVRAGLTALPNAAADAAGGLIISDAGGLDADAMATSVTAIEVDTGTSGVLLASTATSAQLVDDVWDEALTGATHNVPNSAGRRLRALNDFGLYEGGYVWIDTVNGTAGTTDFENGTVNNPVDSIADALTIAASVGLPGFHLLPGSSITLAATVDNYEFVGHGYTVALGGQSISGCLFKNATITGNDDGTNTSAPTFEECSFTDSTLGVHKLIGCSMGGTTTGITLAEAGTYYWDQCYSGVAGTGTPKVTFGTTNQNLNLRHWSGGIQIENMGASASTDNMSVEGWGQVVEGTCTAGTVAVRGNFTTSGITNLTLSDDARIDVAQINAECDTALTDYDPPTKAEMDTAHATTDALITGLNDVAATDIVSNGAITTLSGAVVNVDTVDSVTALASNSITSSVIALNAIDSNGLATSAVNEIATGVTTDMDANSTQLAAIVADTGELQGDWADGGRLDLILDARASQASVDALPSAADVLTTVMTESYGTDGAAVTLAQACYVIMQGINEFAISGTTKTVKQLDGTTTAYTSTLDDATSPTSITRAT